MRSKKVRRLASIALLVVFALSLGRPLHHPADHTDAVPDCRPALGARDQIERAWQDPLDPFFSQMIHEHSLLA
jgi:hypothetical protein